MISRICKYVIEIAKKYVEFLEIREIFEKYFENCTMSRKCIKKYVHFSILVKKMKSQIQLKIDGFAFLSKVIVIFHGHKI